MLPSTVGRDSGVPREGRQGGPQAGSSVSRPASCSSPLTPHPSLCSCLLRGCPWALLYCPLCLSTSHGKFCLHLHVQLGWLRSCSSESVKWSVLLTQQLHTWVFVNRNMSVCLLADLGKAAHSCPVQKSPKLGLPKHPSAVAWISSDTLLQWNPCHGRTNLRNMMVSEISPDSRARAVRFFGCFSMTAAELSHCNRAHGDCKPNIDSLALSEKFANSWSAR